MSPSPSAGWKGHSFLDIPPGLDDKLCVWHGSAGGGGEGSCSKAVRGRQLTCTHLGIEGWKDRLPECRTAGRTEGLTGSAGTLGFRKLRWCNTSEG